VDADSRPTRLFVLGSCFMKKFLSSCKNCGENSSILTQVSSGPEVIFLCSECYNLKYSDQVKDEIKYVEKKD